MFIEKDGYGSVTTLKAITQTSIQTKDTGQTRAADHPRDDTSAKGESRDALARNLNPIGLFVETSWNLIRR